MVCRILFLSVCQVWRNTRDSLCMPVSNRAYIHTYIHILKLLYGDRNASFIWQQEVEGS